MQYFFSFFFFSFCFLDSLYWIFIFVFYFIFLYNNHMSFCFVYHSFIHTSIHHPSHIPHPPQSPCAAGVSLCRRVCELHHRVLAGLCGDVPALAAHFARDPNSTAIVAQTCPYLLRYIIAAFLIKSLVKKLEDLARIINAQETETYASLLFEFLFVVSCFIYLFLLLLFIY